MSSGVQASEGTYSGGNTRWDGRCRCNCLRNRWTVSPGGCAFRVCFLLVPSSPWESQFLHSLTSTWYSRAFQF